MNQGIVLIWNQFGPYHMDRCEALGAHFRERCRVHGVEIASQSEEYAWRTTGSGSCFAKHTLFKDRKLEQVGALFRFVRLLGVVRASRATHIFVNNYNQLEIFLLALTMRLWGRRVYLMFDSKFDDKPRKAWREILKVAMLLPYSGALTGGPRSQSYLRFLGFGKRPIAWGYDTVNLERILQVGGNALAPNDRSFTERYFVIVARFIPEKDLATAIAAYARYRDLAKEAARELHICGAGPLDVAIRRQIADLRLVGVVLHGFLQSTEVPRVLAGGLALVLSSVSETWGLVVNEALAFGLPVLATDQIGARDVLMRTGVNGYIFEPGNVEGLAHLMIRVSNDESEWRRLVEGSRRLRALGDTGRFVEGVTSLMKDAE
jgi:glycosyltransferase involved in cell wall biosynthesis